MNGTTNANLFQGLCDQLQSVRHAPTPTARHADLRAYLLFDTWADNPMAALLAARCPQLADNRCPVPDTCFAHREDEAPCVVPAPDALLYSTAGTVPIAQGLFADLLAQAWQHTEQRLARQPFCAVVWSRADAASIARHWVDLGHQQPPGTDDARLFRYQDPRVMQRVWPMLDAAQRRWWLGPVAQWWALAQPWGPWAPAQFASGGLLHADAPPGWFHAASPQADAPGPGIVHGRRARALFDHAQWQAAHVSPAGNRVWARFAQRGVAARDQPDGDTLLRLLADGRRHGLDGADLEDYAWCTWRPKPLADGTREVNWQSPRAARVLAELLQTLRQDASASFAGLFADALNFRS